MKFKNTFQLISFTGLLALLLIRLFPSKFLDHGIYISVASRLLAGDKLYDEVWDNKQPYFYFALAFARWISPYGDFLLEIFWIALLSGSTFYILRENRIPNRVSNIFGLIVVPFIASGSHYVSGQTHLPAIALYFLMRLLLLRNSSFTGGIILGLILNFNFQIFLFFVLLLFFEPITKILKTNILRFFEGFCASSLFCITLLAARAELNDYFQLYIQNFQYSNEKSVLHSNQSIFAHLINLSSKSGFVSTLSLLVIQFSTYMYFRNQQSRIKTLLKSNYWICISSTISSFIVLSVTGIWSHHLQLLYIPSIELILFLAYFYDEKTFRKPRNICFIILIAAGLSGANPNPYYSSFLNFPNTFSNFSNYTESTQLLRKFQPETNYMRIGSNDDFGHAYGMERWKLNCRIFHQYAFTPASQVRELSLCMDSTDVILISKTGELLLKNSRRNPGWKYYGPRIIKQLTNDFDCKVFKISSEYTKICERKLDKIDSSSIMG